jgi:hypothetical protein
VDIHASERLELETLGHTAGLSPASSSGGALRAPQRTILTHIGVPISMVRPMSVSTPAR